MVTHKSKLKILVVWLTHYGGIDKSHEQYSILPVLKRNNNVTVFPIDPLKQSDSELLDTVNITNPDVMMVRLYGKSIRPETIQYITSRTRTFTVGLFGDDEKQFNCGECSSVKYAPCFDLVTTTWIDAVDMYKDICINPFLISHGAYALKMKRMKLKKNIQVSFVGQMRQNRVYFLNNLLNEGITTMQVFGKGWLKNSNSIPHEQYPIIINRSKININISEDVFEGKKYKQVKARDFEIPMCGGFLLTGYSEDIQYYYNIGKEIETYKNAEECADKIRYYLKNDRLREKIAQRGYERARECYTYEKIYSNLIENIKLNLPKRDN